MLADLNVEYISHMGSDLNVADTARVSFNKKSNLNDDGTLSGRDTKLIDYLARHNHWTPFAHQMVQLRLQAPVPIRTQCFKHKAGFVENEVSRRYVPDDVEFFMPSGWRGKPKDGAKQGSDKAEEIVDLFVKFGGTTTVTETVEEHYERSLYIYNEMLDRGVCVEQARFVLPQGMMVKWVWTGSLAAYARFAKQRLDPHAQYEIQQLAQKVSEIIEPLFPVSWKALIN